MRKVAKRMVVAGMALMMLMGAVFIMGGCNRCCGYEQWHSYDRIQVFLTNEASLMPCEDWDGDYANFEFKEWTVDSVDSSCSELFAGIWFSEGELIRPRRLIRAGYFEADYEERQNLYEYFNLEQGYLENFRRTLTLILAESCRIWIHDVAFMLALHVPYVQAARPSGIVRIPPLQ